MNMELSFSHLDYLIQKWANTQWNNALSFNSFPLYVICFERNIDDEWASIFICARAQSNQITLLCWFIDIIEFYWNVGSLKFDAKLVHGNELFEWTNVIIIFYERILVNINWYSNTFKHLYNNVSYLM